MATVGHNARLRGDCSVMSLDKLGVLTTPASTPSAMLISSTNAETTRPAAGSAITQPRRRCAPPAIRDRSATAGHHQDVDRRDPAKANDLAQNEIQIRADRASGQPSAHLPCRESPRPHLSHRVQTYGAMRRLPAAAASRSSGVHARFVKSFTSRRAFSTCCD